MALSRRRVCALRARPAAGLKAAQWLCEVRSRSQRHAGAGVRGTARSPRRTACARLPVATGTQASRSLALRSQRGGRPLVAGLRARGDLAGDGGLTRVRSRARLPGQRFRPQRAGQRPAPSFKQRWAETQDLTRARPTTPVLVPKSLQGLTGTPLVAGSPIRHDSAVQGSAVEVQTYQPPWKALSEFALQSDLDQPAFQQLVRPGPGRATSGLRQGFRDEAQVAAGEWGLPWDGRLGRWQGAATSPRPPMRPKPGLAGRSAPGRGPGRKPPPEGLGPRLGAPARARPHRSHLCLQVSFSESGSLGNSSGSDVTSLSSQLPDTPNSMVPSPAET